MKRWAKSCNLIQHCSVFDFKSKLLVVLLPMSRINWPLTVCHGIWMDMTVWYRMVFSVLICWTSELSFSNKTSFGRFWRYQFSYDSLNHNLWDRHVFIQPTVNNSSAPCRRRCHRRERYWQAAAKASTDGLTEIPVTRASEEKTTDKITTKKRAILGHSNFNQP